MENRSPSPRALKVAFLMAAGATFLLFTANFYLIGFGVISDGQGYYAQLRSVVFDGDLVVSNEYEFFSTSASKFGGGIRWTDPIPEYSYYPIGMSLLLAPFFLLGHGLASLLNGLGMEVATDGLSWPYEYLYCSGSILLGLAGLVLCYRAAKTYFSPWAAALAVAGVWFASPLTFYLIMEPSMSHAVSQFTISLFLYLCLLTPWKESLRRCVCIGLILGLAGLIRPQNLLFCVVPVVLFLSEGRRHIVSPMNWRPLVVMGVCSVLVFLLQVVVYTLAYGGFMESPYLHSGEDVGQSATFFWLRPNILPTLFSGFHGLYSWHPLLLLGTGGLFLALRRHRQPATVLLLALALQIYLVSAWWCWWQGASFGGRMFSNCSFAFVFGLAAMWHWFSQRAGRMAATGITLFFMGWNVLLVMQFESGLLDANQRVTNRELIAGQIRAVPHFYQHLMQR